MADSYAGVTVPAGSPAGLRDAARQFSAVSDGLRESADELGGMPTSLGSWQGPASANYAGSCLTASQAARRSAQGWQARSGAIEAYAEELEDARRDAREAIVDAKEAKRRMNKAKIELGQARRRLSDAVGRIGQAQQQIAASAGSAKPDLAAEAALRQAERDADKAEQDIRHWRREYEDAEGEFERAVRRGSRAEQRAETAAGAARSALRGVDQAEPYWVPASVPALKPLSGLAPDPPDVDEGFCDGGLGGVICDGGDFVGDVGYGLGKGGEELFTAATHPGDTAEALWYSGTHPAATLDALANSCDGMSAGDCIGYVGAAAVGTKGAGKLATTARRGKPDADAPSAKPAPAAAPPGKFPPGTTITLDGKVLARTDADGKTVFLNRPELKTEIGDARQSMDLTGGVAERLRPPSEMRHGTPAPKVTTKRQVAVELVRVLGKALEDAGGP